VKTATSQFSSSNPNAPPLPALSSISLFVTTFVGTLCSFNTLALSPPVALNTVNNPFAPFATPSKVILNGTEEVALYIAVLNVYFPSPEVPATQYAGPNWESEVTGTVDV
jgi:hypothetical protein